MNSGFSDSDWSLIEFGFSMVYVVDFSCRMLVLSWPEYWSDAGNKFDFVVTWTLFVVGVVRPFPPPHPFFQVTSAPEWCECMGKSDLQDGQPIKSTNLPP